MSKVSALLTVTLSLAMPMRPAAANAPRSSARFAAPGFALYKGSACVQRQDGFIECDARTIDGAEQVGTFAFLLTSKGFEIWQYDIWGVGTLEISEAHGGSHGSGLDAAVKDALLCGPHNGELGIGFWRGAITQATGALTAFVGGFAELLPVFVYDGSQLTNETFGLTRLVATPMCQ